jgi:predicted nucleic acid-binding protein
MTTAIDTNVLVALWDAGDSLHVTARQALEAAFARGGLVIPGVVYAELLAAPSRTEEFLKRFCEDTSIRIEWEMAEEVWRAAGRAYQSYAVRRKKQAGLRSRRILADFLIGAHAMVNRYPLLTLDTGLYRAAFPRLSIVAI